MPQVREVYTFLDEWAPFATQLAMDNAGLLIGSETAEVVGITVCFDITVDVVRQAAAAGHSLLVSHHPVIFHPLRRVEGESIPYLLAAAQKHSSICCENFARTLPGLELKEIINAHKQNINVISTVGVGTEFIFTLEKAK